ncbi:MAG: GAF domain-containing sensor histidine kinase, partial [Candidatus Hydrothermarchaeales archaeon]
LMGTHTRYNGSSIEDRGRLGEEAMDSHKDLLLLQRINNVLNSTMDLNEILGAITDGLVSTLDYDTSAISLLSDDGRYLTVRSAGMDSKMLKTVERLTRMKVEGYNIPLFEGSMLKEVIDTKKAIVTHDPVRYYEDWTDKKFLKPLARGIVQVTRGKSLITVPLSANNNVVGIIGVGSKKELSDKDVKRLTAFGEQAGLAVEKARTYEELQDRTRRLEIAYEGLMELDRMKDDFLSTVSHELKTPLTAIKGCLQLLRDDVDGEEPLEYLSVAEMESTRLNDLIEDILDLSRSSTLLEKIEFNRASMRSIILAALNEVQFQANAKEIKVELDVEDVEVRCDKIQMERAIKNLLSNAVKFNNRGGSVTIKSKAKKDKVVVSVEDAGIGIPKEHLDKVFEKFYRVDHGDAKEYYGTGLGLSIVKNIIEAHKGSIDVKSKVGKGTKFVLSIPLGVV